MQLVRLNTHTRRKCSCHNRREGNGRILTLSPTPTPRATPIAMRCKCYTKKLRLSPKHRDCYPHTHPHKTKHTSVDRVSGVDRQVSLLNDSLHSCCSVLQCVAVCCSVLQVSLLIDTSLSKHVKHLANNPTSLHSSCSVLQCVAVCCSVLQCVAVCCRQTIPPPYTHAARQVCASNTPHTPSKTPHTPSKTPHTPSNTPHTPKICASKTPHTPKVRASKTDMHKRYAQQVSTTRLRQP